MSCSPIAISGRVLSHGTSANCRISEIEAALEAGAARARQHLLSGLIEGATLRLMGKTAVVGTSRNQLRAPETLRRHTPEMMHA